MERSFQIRNRRRLDKSSVLKNLDIYIVCEFKGRRVYFDSSIFVVLFVDRNDGSDLA